MADGEATITDMKKAYSNWLMAEALYTMAEEAAGGDRELPLLEVIVNVEGQAKRVGVDVQLMASIDAKAADNVIGALKDYAERQYSKQLDLLAVTSAEAVELIVDQ